MEAYSKAQVKTGLSHQEEIVLDLEAWFSVSGDMDDFIFYEDTDKQHSEK